jgi:hypothetical protein
MSRLQIALTDQPTTVLHAERLRDGRVALGTRTQAADGHWTAGELHLLEPTAFLALGAWLAQPIEEAWIGSVRERREEQLRTAQDLYGPGAGSVRRLADDVLRELPRPLLVRAMILLLNSLGPAEHDRRVAQLNAEPAGPAEDELRRALEELREGFAYALSAASLFDALEAGVDTE